MSNKICLHCGKTINTDGFFCEHCGEVISFVVEIDQETLLEPSKNCKKCFHCGKEIKTNGFFCEHCGEPIPIGSEFGESKSKNENQKTKAVDRSRKLVRYEGKQSNVNIASIVTYIDDNAFRQCSHVVRVNIHNGVTGIGDRAFIGCAGLERIVISNNVVVIGVYAFSGCTKLKDVYYTGTEEEWSKISIGLGNELLNNAKIHFNSKI